MLYSGEPDVSVWPVAVMRALPVFLKESTACSITFRAGTDSFVLSQSKNTLKDGAVA